MLVGSYTHIATAPTKRVPVEYKAIALRQPLQAHTIMGNFIAWPFEPVSYTPAPSLDKLQGPSTLRLQWTSIPTVHFVAGTWPPSNSTCVCTT